MKPLNFPGQAQPETPNSQPVTSGQGRKPLKVGQLCRLQECRSFSKTLATGTVNFNNCSVAVILIVTIGLSTSCSKQNLAPEQSSYIQPAVNSTSYLEPVVVRLANLVIRFNSGNNTSFSV